MIKSLKDMGLKPVVHKEAVVLGGNYNSRQVKGHIVIPGSQFNATYGDVGFERTNKGFVMHADHVDIKKFNLTGLNKCYMENKLKKYVRSTSKCNILSRRENNKGQIEVQLRIQQ